MSGSELFVAFSPLVAVVVTLLGITFLFQADTEGKIAANERDRTQTLAIAEAGARLVKYWYDHPTKGNVGSGTPLFLNTYDMRKLQYWDVNQRLMNSDGDPGTAPLASGDVGWVYYMEGVTAPASPGVVGGSLIK